MVSMKLLFFSLFFLTQSIILKFRSFSLSHSYKILLRQTIKSMRFFLSFSLLFLPRRQQEHHLHTSSSALNKHLLSGYLLSLSFSAFNTHALNSLKARAQPAEERKRTKAQNYNRDQSENRREIDQIIDCRQIDVNGGIVKNTIDWEKQ